MTAQKNVSININWTDNTWKAFQSTWKSMNRLKDRMKSVWNTIWKVSTWIVTAIGWFATKAVSDFTSMWRELNNLSQMTWVSVEELSKLQYAAEQTGVSTKHLWDALADQGPFLNDLKNWAANAKEAASALWLSYEELNKQNPNEMFMSIAREISNLEDEQRRVTIASKIFWDNVWQELVPLLSQWEEWLKKLKDEAEKTGNVMDEEASEDAVKFDKAMWKLKSTLSWVSVQIWGVIVPKLTEFAKKIPTEKITNWIKENKELIVQIWKIVGAVTWLASAIWLLKGVFSPIIWVIISVIKIFWKLWGVILYLVKGIKWLIPFILNLWRVFFFWATAISTVAWLVWNYRDEIVDATLWLGREIKSIFNDIWGFISNAWDNIGKWSSETMESIWNSTKNWIDAIKGFFGKWFDFIWNTIQWLWDKLQNFWIFFSTSFKNWIQNSISWLKGVFNEVVNTIKDAFTQLPSMAFNWWANLMNNLIDWITWKIWDLRNSLSNVAWNMKGFLWFSSPTEEWPWKTADQWMPNLINMMSKQLQGWVWEIQSAVWLIWWEIQRGIQPQKETQIQNIEGWRTNNITIENTFQIQWDWNSEDIANNVLEILNNQIDAKLRKQR